VYRVPCSYSLDTILDMVLLDIMHFDEAFVCEIVWSIITI